MRALDERLLPLDSAVSDWPLVALDADSAYYMQQGQPVIAPKAPTEGWVRLYNNKRFFNISEIQNDDADSSANSDEQVATDVDGSNHVS